MKYRVTITIEACKITKYLDSWHHCNNLTVRSSVRIVGAKSWNDVMYRNDSIVRFFFENASIICSYSGI